MDDSRQDGTRPATLLTDAESSSKNERAWFTPPQWLLTAAAFVICVAALTREPARDLPTPADLESPIANREIRATFYFESVDLQRTHEARESELAKVPNYYRIDQGRVQQQIQRLRQQIDRLGEMRPMAEQAVVQALRSAPPDQPSDVVAVRAIAGIVGTLRESYSEEDLPEADLLALWLLPDASSLPERIIGESPDSAPTSPSVRLVPDPPELAFDKSGIMANIALEALEYVLTAGVRPENLPLGADTQRIVLMRERPPQNLPITSEMLYGEIPDVNRAVEELNVRVTTLAQRAAREIAASDRWARMHDAALSMARPLIVSTIQEDTVYTEGVWARVAESVPPVMKEIEAGEIIQDRGKRWTKQSRSDVQTYLDVIAREERPFRRVAGTLAAHVILVFLVFQGLYKRMRFQEDIKVVDPIKAFNLALLLLCATLCVGRIISYFEPTGYVLPVATAGILFAILVGPQRAALFGAMVAALVSAQYHYNWRLLLVAGAMTIAGAFSIYGVRRRSDMTAASLVATLVGLLAAGAAILATDTLFGDIFVRRILLIVLNGALCLLAVPGLLPWLEKLFDITTDIQLLEYSDLNNELLGKLAMAAPATYAHSLLLGQLAEAAANAIGANGLMARVCAYYHDLGKKNKPEHFTENQGGSRNIHDGLPPLVSARMIRKHVLDGAREAREHGLPRPIIDGILQHHGTYRIGFFYDLARKQHPEIPEEEFRYPGPKPLRPETAILMICDASESGVRSLGNPTLQEARQFIDRIIRDRAEDGQFEDCDLTLKQLALIRDVVAETLVNSRHSRIAYPHLSGIVETNARGTAPTDTNVPVSNIVPISSGKET